MPSDQEDYAGAHNGRSENFVPEVSQTLGALPKGLSHSRVYFYADLQPRWVLDPTTKVGKGECSIAYCEGASAFVTWRGRWWGLCIVHRNR